MPWLVRYRDGVLGLDRPGSDTKEETEQEQAEARHTVMRHWLSGKA